MAIHRLSILPTRVDCLAWYPYSESLDKALTFATPYGETIRYGTRVGNMLGLPLAFAPLNLAGVPDYRVLNYLGAFLPKASPRTEEQKGLIQESYNLLAKGESHICEAPTGYGKTYVGTTLAALLGQKTLIVTPKTDLAEQWVKTLVELTGVPLHEIGTIKQDKCDVDGKRFVIASLHSLAIEDRYPQEKLAQFGFVIFDEVHRLGADHFAKVAAMLPARLKLGLSAKSKRSDRRDQLFQAHIGPVMVKGGSVPLKPKVIMLKTQAGFPEWMKNMQPGRTMHAIKWLEDNQARNTLVVGFVMAAMRRDRTLVILSDTVSHLDKIKALLGAAGMSGDKIGVYTGSTRKELRKSEAAKPVILATYRFASEGTDFPDWDTMVLLHPRADAQQAVGRVLREKEGKETPTILDLIDDHHLFRAFSLRRKLYYAQIGAEIVEKDRLI